MSDDAADGDVERYGEILKSLLSQLSPQLQKMESIVGEVRVTAGLDVQQLDEKPPEDLYEILIQVERVEDYLLTLGKHILPSFNQPIKPDFPQLDNSSEEKSEAILVKFLPRILASLEVIEKSIAQLNAAISQEDIQSAVEVNASTVEEMQESVITQTNRITENLILLKEALGNLSQEEADQEPQIELLYSPPPWSTPPSTAFYFEVREGEAIAEKVAVNIKGNYLIGRLPICDIVVDDATCSRQHAVVQFRPGDPNPKNGLRQDEVYIYDLGSTSGTYVNGMPLQAKAYYPLYKGDVLQFGQYARCFVLRDGSDSKEGATPEAGAEANSNGTADNKEETNNEKKEEETNESEEKKSLDTVLLITDPKSPDFDEEAYKQAMIEKYMQQQRENEEILKRKKEREAQGLPPIADIPYVPERAPKGKGKKGKKGKKEDCIIS